MSFKFNYIPIAPAIDFHTSKHNIDMLVCGARSGKSKAVFAECAMYAVIQPGIWERDIKNGEYYTIIVGEPTAVMTKRIAWRHIMRNLPKDRIINYNMSDRSIYIRGIHGITEIIFFSYEQGSERIEGLSSVYRAYLDEFFQMDESHFDEVQTRLSERLGKMICSGTPKPKQWILDKIKDKEKYDINFITWKTSDNPYFPKQRLEYLKNILSPKIFARNFEASLDCFEGQIFDMFNEKIHVKSFEHDPEKYTCLWSGQDWGYTHHGVFVLVGLRKNGYIDVIDEVAEKGLIIDSQDIDADSWVKRVKEKQEMYGYLENGKEYSFDMCYCGQDEPASTKTYFLNSIPAKPCDNAVLPGLTFLMSLMMVDKNGISRLRIHPRCKVLIEQLKVYKWASKKEGNTKEEPFKENDDAPDALRYALYSGRRMIKDLADEIEFLFERGEANNAS